MDLSILNTIFSFCIGALVSWTLIRARSGLFEEKKRRSLHTLETTLTQKVKETEAVIQEKEKEFEHQISQEKKFLKDEKTRLKLLKEELTEKETYYHKLDKTLQQKNAQLLQEQIKIQEKEKNLLECYEELSSMTQSRAQEELFNRAKISISNQIDSHKKEAFSKLHEELTAKSFEALQSALERTLSYLSTKEYFTDIIHFPSASYEKIIPRLIGKDGRNIQTLEKSIGVHIVFDAKEESATIASSNAEQRWIGKHVLYNLSKIEKITPSRVLEEIEAVQRQINEPLFFPEVLEKIAKIIPDIHSIHPEVRKKINRLFLTNSLGQNLFLHSLEVAYLMQSIAESLDISTQYMAMTGLFHDIGKVIDYSWGNTHTKAGAAFLRNYNFPNVVTEAILAHHGEAKKDSPEATLLVIADRISGGCLQARTKSITTKDTPPFQPIHVKLVKEIEEDIKTLPNILSAWASFAQHEEHIHGTIEIVIRPIAPLDSEAQLDMKKNVTQKVRQKVPSNKIQITVLS